MNKIELILTLANTIAEWLIVIMLTDDIYGISNIRKLSKRRWRKFQRDFMKASKKYFKKATKSLEPVTNEQQQ